MNTKRSPMSLDRIFIQIEQHIKRSILECLTFNLLAINQTIYNFPNSSHTVRHDVELWKTNSTFSNIKFIPNINKNSKYKENSVRFCWTIKLGLEISILSFSNKNKPRKFDELNLNLSNKCIYLLYISLIKYPKKKSHVGHYS